MLIVNDCVGVDGRTIVNIGGARYEVMDAQKAGEVLQTALDGKDKGFAKIAVAMLIAFGVLIEVD